MNYIRPQEPPHWSTPAQEPPPFHWLPVVLAFLRRRWPSIAIAVGIAVVLAAAHVLTATPRFTAEADLLFDIRRVDLLRQQAATQDAMTLNSVLESQVELLQSAGLARKTVERLGLTKDRDFVAVRPSLVEHLRWVLDSLRGKPDVNDGPDAKLDMAAQQLMRMLKIRRVGQTYVIAISVTSPSPDEAAWLANGVAETYLADELEAKEDGILQATGWLQVRLKELHDQALTADRAVQDFKAEHNIIDTDHGLMSSQQLTELSSQLISARANTATMLARLQRIQSIMTDGIDGGNVTDGLDNKVIITLRQQYVDDDRRAADLSTKFGKDHAVVRDLRNEMAEIKKSIQSELGRIADTYKSDYEVAHANEASVQARLDKMVAAAAQTNNDLVLLRSLQSSADTYRSLYQNFLQRYTQAVQDQSFPVPEARTITTALPPLRKSEPKTMMVMALAAVLGLSMGFAIAFVREVLDRGIRSPAQLRAATGLDCLAIVPRLRQRGRRRMRRQVAGSALPSAAVARGLLSAPGSAMQHVFDRPNSAFTEAIRTLRMRIISQRMRARDVKVIGCVSSSRGAGASTVACNLAQLLAQSSGRTILLDWDFANASLSLRLIGRTTPGCTDVLAGRSKLAAAVCNDDQTDMNFLAAGWWDSNSPSSTLVHSEQMHDMLSELRATYSYVVVDLPSLSTLADAHIAAHMLDGIIVVAEWGQSEREPLLDKLARIGHDQTNVLGVVLNKATEKAQWNEQPATGFAGAVSVS